MLEIVLDNLDGDNNPVNNNKRHYCSTNNRSEIDLKNDGIIDKNNSTKKLKPETITKILDLNNLFIISKMNLRLRPFRPKELKNNHLMPIVVIELTKKSIDTLKTITS
ncbi:hypothetical protein H311_01808 [Anncaliia algerae PRA109]|nr:hypothetical protein H311_01808 [Anncaliia algerae PRA109]